jgi:hypothetical protein
MSNAPACGLLRGKLSGLLRGKLSGLLRGKPSWLLRSDSCRLLRSLAPLKKRPLAYRRTRQTTKNDRLSYGNWPVFHPALVVGGGGLVKEPAI